MCDYSLHSVRSRAAKAGDQLVVACFAHTSTRGLASLDEPAVAVCLRPGTELVFDKDVAWGLPLSMFFPEAPVFGEIGSLSPDQHGAE